VTCHFGQGNESASSAKDGKFFALNTKEFLKFASVPWSKKIKFLQGILQLPGDEERPR
jgi:hypothetical protein